MKKDYESPCCLVVTFNVTGNYAQGIIATSGEDGGSNGGEDDDVQDLVKGQRYNVWDDDWSK